jgi:DnaJ-class molecular chaperone
MAKRGDGIRKVVKLFKDADDICEIVTGQRLHQVGKRLIDAYGEDIGKKIQEALGTQEEELPADNPYSVLHCRPDANDLVIRGRYRLLVKEFHPDGTNPDPEQFKRVVDAYNAIKLLRENIDRE